MKGNKVGNMSVYIPKHERSFLNICFCYAKEAFPDFSFSQFILMCIKNYINTMDRENKKVFEDQAYKLAQKEKPKATEYVDRFIKEN